MSKNTNKSEDSNTSVKQNIPENEPSVSVTDSAGTDIKEKMLCRIFCFVCFIIVMFVQTEPLYPFDEAVLGHDFSYHYLRTEALAQKIRDRAFFTGGIDYLFNNGAGYASSTAYPDFMLIIPALLRITGLSIGNSMAAFIIICSILTYLTMFTAVKGITGSPVCASTACAVSMLTFYRMDNLYTRFALGEVQAFIFWPLIIYGLYDLIEKDFKKPYLLGIGFAGMIMTHTISTVIAVALCVVFVLVYVRDMLRAPKKFLKIAATAAAVLALTSYYWIPLLELLGSCELTYSHPYALSENHQVSLFDIFRDISVVGIGIMLFLLQLPRVLLLKNSVIRTAVQDNDENFRKILKFADVSLVLSLVMIFMASDAAPWSVLKYALNFMQFPWRMYGAATLLMSFSASVYIYYVLKHTNVRYIGMMAVTLAVCFNFAVHEDAMDYKKFYALGDDHYQNAENTYALGYGEWLPWKAKCASSENEEEFRSRTSVILTDSNNTISGERAADRVKFEMPDYLCSYIDVPLIWYKGYTAADSSGNELGITMSDMGFVRIDTSSASGTVEVKYHISSLTVLSYIISSVTAAGTVLLYVLCTLKKRRSVK